MPDTSSAVAPSDIVSGHKSDTRTDSQKSAANNVIELTLPAAPTHLAAARALAAELTGRMDFNLDEIDDTRMAVDEACATLVDLAVPSSTLSCVFTLRPDEIEVETWVSVVHGHQLDEGTFGWRVLTTLVDEVVALSARIGGHGDKTGYQVGLRLRKRRQEPIE
ncbi:MAG: ATP-binding protein [Terriglobales bacterium]